MDHKWTQDYYGQKELEHIDLVECWAWCVGAFFVVTGLVIGCVWMVKGFIWLFARMLGL